MPGIEAAACQIRIKGKDLCVASIYVPPKGPLGKRQLYDIAKLLPEPQLIVGDYNSHGTGWGSIFDDNRSNLIYNLCDNFNLTIGEQIVLRAHCKHFIVYKCSCKLYRSKKLPLLSNRGKLKFRLFCCCSFDCCYQRWRKLDGLSVLR